MANLDDAVNALLPVMNQFQPLLKTWLATAGDGHGTVIDTSIPNHVFVRVLNNAVGTAPAVQTISVFNDVGLLSDGDRCVIGFGHERPRLLRVLARQDQRYDTVSGDGGSSGSNLGVLPHAWQHAWLAPDPVFIDFFQVINLGVYPAGGLTVAIKRGIIPRIGVDTLVDNQTLDLSSYQPVSGALWALLSVAPTGSITVTLSATVGSIVNLDYTLIPDTPVGNFRLAAVALYDTQTDIVLNSTRQDIFDLRWPQESIPGTVSAPGSTAILFLTDDPSSTTVERLTTTQDVSSTTDTVSVTSASTLIVSFITPKGSPQIELIPAGVVNVHLNAYQAGSGIVQLYWELVKVTPGGTPTLLATSGHTGNLTGSGMDYSIPAVIGDTNLGADNRLLLRVYGDLISGPATNASIVFGGATLARLTLPAAGGGSGGGNIPLADGHLLIGGNDGIAHDKAMSSDATINRDGAVTLAAVNSNVGTFGDATHVAQVTLNAKGLVTAAANVAIDVGKYRQFVYTVSGGDFQFVKTSDGNPVTVLLSLE